MLALWNLRRMRRARARRQRPGRRTTQWAMVGTRACRWPRWWPICDDGSWSRLSCRSRSCCGPPLVAMSVISGFGSLADQDETDGVLGVDSGDDCVGGGNVRMPVRERGLCLRQELLSLGEMTACCLERCHPGTGWTMVSRSAPANVMPSLATRRCNWSRAPRSASIARYDRWSRLSSYPPGTFATSPCSPSPMSSLHHGTGKPIGGPSRPYGPRKNKKSEPQRGLGPCRCLATSQSGAGGNRIPRNRVARC